MARAAGPRSIAFSADMVRQAPQIEHIETAAENTGVHDFEPLLTATLERFAHK